MTNPSPMKNSSHQSGQTAHPRGRLGALIFSLCVGLLMCGTAKAANLKVVKIVKNGDGTSQRVPITNFRWMLEEDNTNPGVPGTPRVDTVSLVIHQSHAPVAATGDSATTLQSGEAYVLPADPAKRYLVTVLADGFSAGGTSLAKNQTDVEVVLNPNPLPTAQISVLAFEDHNSINNVPDADEPGIPGCHVVLADFLGGPILTDTFGNPLGTTYHVGTDGNYELDADGAPVVEVLGSGAIYTDKDGKALIKNLAMGKYGVQVIPPTGSDWTGGHATTPNINGAYHQTATIEGTPTVDAWVAPNEPTIFMEGFGPGTYHVFFGFVDPKKLPGLGTGSNSSRVTLKGVNRFNHFGAPPNNQQFVTGPPVTEAWVALNDMSAGATGNGLIAIPCDPESGEFSIPGVRAGQQYQLVTWDKPLDALFTTTTITIPPANQVPSVNGVRTYDIGTVLCSRWFGTLEGSVFYDTNKNGYRDANEVGIAQQPLNIRWRDGTIYQSTITDKTGDYSFTEVFPFFKWLIAEVGFTSLKPTGMTTIVDAGGGVDDGAGGLYLPKSPDAKDPNGYYDGVRVPQNQPDTGLPYRTELSTDPAAPLLLEATHLFLNQNNRIDWGKVNYGTTPDGRPENGGIAGVVGYGATRAEEDPRQGTIDPWESGIPRVQMVLYQDKIDTNGNPKPDKIIDDVNHDGHVTLADIDNYPFGFRDGEAPGPEDVDRNGNNQFDAGDAIQIVWTDSFDDSQPEGSVQPNPPLISGYDKDGNYVTDKPIVGSDNYATWNQVREGVFDGGYLFGSYYPDGVAAHPLVEDPTTHEISRPGSVNYLPPGMYIVESCPPPGYLIQTEESFNVVFGDTYQPSKLLLPPELVGTPENHAGDTYLKNYLPAVRQTLPNLFTVPQYLSLFPDQHIECSFAGQERPIADMKWVRVAAGKNAAADFHVYTEVPKATRVVGFVLNDLTAEFNSKNPIFGEKGAPGWLPIGVYDWAGNELLRTYSDEYGSYEFLAPSSVSAAIPMPSGFAPNMLTLILNDPTMPDPNHPGQRIPDPYYNPAFATVPWTLHYYPATFLYADTPIVPVAAFVGGPNKTLDIEPTAGTPVIRNVEVVSSADYNQILVAGAYVPRPPLAIMPVGVVKIESLGMVHVPNPDYKSGSIEPATVSRDFGFGTDVGSVKVGGNSANVIQWSNDTIIVDIRTALAEGQSGQIMVTRGDTQKTTPIGVTLTRGAIGEIVDTDSTVGNVHIVKPVDFALQPLATPIQDMIDKASPGDLIIVSEGNYYENPILHKAVRLQGSGLGTVLNVNPNPPEKLQRWHSKVAEILGGDPFTANEAPGIMVLGNANFAAMATAGKPARIDGFQIKGDISGGGITVWDQAASLRISNNRIIGNQGSFTGGISLGEQAQAATLFDNPNVVIEYNQIFQNGGIDGGGGIGIHNGATGYTIRNNYIMGNFTRGNGAGISHEGRSPGGLIANNVIAYNEVYYGTPPAGDTAVTSVGDGAGIFIAGDLTAVGALSDGSGSVTIINNLIQGNLAGAGRGGGIRAQGINGADVSASSNANNWYALDIFNNIIVNNVAGYHGGGISLADALKVRIYHNTIADNDSTSTAAAAFQAGNTSTAYAGGLTSEQTSDALIAALPSNQRSANRYSVPTLRNDIFANNRSFNFIRSNNPLDPGETGLTAQGVNNLQFVGAYSPKPTFNVGTCLVTSGNTIFVSPLLNDLQTAAVIDENGNNVSVRMLQTGIFNPDGTSLADYHLNGHTTTILATDATIPGVNGLATDYDGESRTGVTPDAGADQYFQGHVGILPVIGTEAAAIHLAGGPAATGDVPPITATANGAGVPPTEPMAPLYLNPLPGDPLNPLLDPEPNIDTDGDGIPDNDVTYYQLAAGDGWARMADGTDLYTFGFSDATQTVLDGTAKANARNTLADNVRTQALRLPGNNSSRAQVKANILSYANALTNGDPLKQPLIDQANRLPGNNNNTRNDIRDQLLALSDTARADVEVALRGIGTEVMRNGLLHANLSAPTMVMQEGRHTYLDLSNVGMVMRPDLFDPHTVHFHGFPQAASIFDGEPMASIAIGMGGTLRYYYRIVEPGTYFYHCHVEATEHMQMGMIGNLYVLPKQNNLPEGTNLKGFIHHKGYKYAYNDGDGSTHYDVDAPIQVTGFDRDFHEKHIAVQPLPFAALADDYPLLNGRGYPDTTVDGPLTVPASNDYKDYGDKTSQKTTSLIKATKGQKILLRFSNVSETDFQTLTVLGIPMKWVGKDARLLRGPDPDGDGPLVGQNVYEDTTSITIGGGETADAILDTSSVAAGTYMLYTSRLNHLSNDNQDYGGAMTEIVVSDPSAIASVTP